MCRRDASLFYMFTEDTILGNIKNSDRLQC